MTDQQRARVVEEARRLAGVPFQHAGRGEFGLDCVGLLVVAMKNAGTPVYDNGSYSRVVDSGYMLAELANACYELPFGSWPQPGDVMLFNIGGSPQHLAMITECSLGRAMRIIHSYQTIGRVVEHDLDETWMRRLVGLYSWRAP